MSDQTQDPDSAEPSSPSAAGTNTDLTIARLIEENRNLTARAAQQASLLDAVLSNDPGAVAVFRGPDLRLEMANPGYRALFAVFAKEDHIGRPIDQIFPDRIDSLHRKMLDEVLRTGQAHHY